MNKKPLAFALISQTAYWITAASAALFVPLEPQFTQQDVYQRILPYPLWTLGNFDGIHYTRIAEHGYRPFDYPFFPLYPLVIRLLHTATLLSYLGSAILISIASLTAALYLVQKLSRIDHADSTLLFGIILLFPTAFFYGAAYNDSLFFMLATATLFMGRRKLWLSACLIATLATLTRLNGLALAFFLAAEYLGMQAPMRFTDVKREFGKIQESVKDIHTLVRSGILAILLIPGAFVCYLAYIQYAAGSWRMLFDGMKTWQHDKPVIPFQVFWRYFNIIVLHPQWTLTYAVAAIELGFVLFYLGMLVYSYKKIRFSYWIFCAVSILIPSLTGTFQGMPRYGLHLYPLFLSVSIVLKQSRPSRRLLYFAISGILLYICVSLFTRGYFIS